MTLRSEVEAEALEANRAAPHLTDDAVGAAIVAAAALVRKRRARVHRSTPALVVVFAVP